MTSSLSKREKIRRKPLSRRKSLSTSFLTAVEHAVVFPRLQAVALGRHDGNPPKIQSQLAGLVVLVGTVHQQRQRRGQRPQAGEQIAALRGVVRLAGRERKRYRRSSIRGNQMNLGGPSTAGFADRLRTVFFNAPVPSGCTFTMVESIETASTRMRTSCSRWSFSKTASSTRSWTSGSSGCRWCASCQSAWADRATCSPAQPHTKWRSRPSGSKD